jgi:hypothetical protein
MILFNDFKNLIQEIKPIGVYMESNELSDDFSKEEVDKEIDTKYFLILASFKVKESNALFSSKETSITDISYTVYRKHDCSEMQLNKRQRFKLTTEIEQQIITKY